jgi:hypothetical protein
MPERRFPGHLRLSPALERFLDERGIRSLDDVRRTGGIARLEGLPVPADDPAIRILEAHTDLGRLATSDALVGRLIENGYDSVVAVAEAPRGEFVARVAPTVGDAAAVRMHADAVAQTGYLTNLLAAWRAERGTGYAVDGQDGVAASAGEATARCHCDDCETAISPGAYLAELVDYALRRLRRNGSRLGLDELGGLLYQPLDALPMSCDSSTTQVRQVRLAVEVLRRYLAAHPAPAGGGVVALGQVDPLARAYRVAAYTTLLVRIGTSYEEVRLARLAAAEERQRLADRLGIDLHPVFLPWGRPGVLYLTNTLDALALDPRASSLQPAALTEPTLEQLFGLIDTTRDPLTAGSPSYLEQWRLEHLRTLWREQDRPTDAYAESLTAADGRRPVIDPDLIGPDDFREPVQKAAVADPDGPFDIWLARREWADTLLARYRQDREANGLQFVLRLALGALLPDLDALGADLGQSADPARTAEAARAIREDLRLSLDAFQRLMAIRARARLAALDARNGPVTEAEWEDVYAILVQSRKESLRATWLAEESAAGIRLGPAQFWTSLREPAQGEWPPRLDAETPLIDPDLLKLSDLPEPGVGRAAADLLATRGAELNGIRASLRAAREAAPATGFGRALELALGQPTPGDPLPYDLDDLAADLEGSPTVAATARARITDDLRLTEASFERLLAIRAKDSQTDPAGKPTLAEYDEAYDILTPARKLIHEYPKWAAAEQAAGIVYWNALKARLPRWRASAETRLEWTRALAVRSEPPIIDPDVIGLGDLRTSTPPDAAYVVWRERTEWLATESAALAVAGTAADPLTGLDTVVQRVLGLAPADVQALDESRRSGADLAGRLAQLGLTGPAFTRLVAIRRLLAAAQPILVEEWAAVWNILLQALKRRRFGEWREREGADEIVRGPDSFKPPEVDPTLFPPPPGWTPVEWRSTFEDRRRWTEQLSARLDQEQAVRDGLRAAVSAAEESALPVLRDALIGVSGAPGNGTAAQAKWLGDRLLIDLQAGGCQQTTRVAQAIESVQTLIWSVRTGQLRDTYPDLTLDAPDFDLEWPWIGSYAAYRAANFVFLYPECLLLPGLRTRQSGPFRALLRQIRDARRLTAPAARDAARIYDAYFRDVCSLRVDTTCVADVPVQVGPSEIDVERRPVVFLFGTGGATGAPYWSRYDDADPSGYAHGFWEPVPGLTGVVSLAGAVPYQVAPGERFLFVFVLGHEKGKQKLMVVKYDLERSRWVGDGAELDLPKITDDSPIEFTAIVEQRPGETAPPHVVVQRVVPDRVSLVASRTMDREGTGWRDDNWQTLATLNSFLSGGLLALAGTGTAGDYYLVLVNAQTGSWQYRLFGSRVEQVGSWKLVPNVSSSPFQGAFCWPGSQDLLLFSRTTVAGTTFTNATWVKPGQAPGAGGTRTDQYSPATQAVTTLPHSIDWVPPSGGGTAGPVLLSFRSRGTSYRFTLARNGDAVTAPSTPVALMPEVKDPLAVTDRISAAATTDRRTRIQAQVTANRGGLLSNLAYIEEAYYFAPLAIGMQLQAVGLYVEALDWYRTAYDYGSPLELRAVYPWSDTDVTTFRHAADWLVDPLDPHRIAATRTKAYTRFTLLTLIGCFLDYADSEFTQDTAESVPRARILYLTALELLDAPELRQALGTCEELIGRLLVRIGDSAIRAEIGRRLRAIEDTSRLSIAVERAAKVLTEDLSWDAKGERLLATAEPSEVDTPPAPTLARVVGDRRGAVARAQAALTADTAVLEVAQGVGAAYAASAATPDPARKPPWGQYVPTPPLQFCVPPNPLLRALRLRAELNLYKLRHCRNIAGLERALEPYAAATDAESGFPTIGAGGQLTLPGAAELRPTLYRYTVLIERAKQLAQLASQVEGSMLAALEKRDAEAYSILKSRQDARLARAGVQLQELRVAEAEAGVRLAELQRDRVQISIDHYTGLINEDLSQLEEAALGLQTAGVVHLHVAAAIKEATTFGVGGIGDVGGALIATASLLQTIASYERRKQDWQFQLSLSEQDLAISNQQVSLAGDRVRVVGQERAIAQLQSDGADAALEFLSTKFTNAELYEWMSRVLASVYAQLLQHGTAVAKLAEDQLAFERHQRPSTIIRTDYWQPPAESDGGAAVGAGPDRRGLTGSARLLADLARLELYALETNQRKLQLSKTLSLATLAPWEFQRFRETGVLTFRSGMELFDRDFPGHYLRLVKRVRTSVVALIPPTQGIRATLSTTGISRVVIGGNAFQSEVIRRGPERVALSSPVNATGLFELEPQPELLFPFESIGVDTVWELRLPRPANPFDFRTIADVLVTIEYSALESFEYAQQVIATLPSVLSADRSFSFRHQLADQWYDLHNPDQRATPMTVRFTTGREDFPPGVDGVRIAQVLLYVARAAGQSFEVPVQRLTFTEPAGAPVGGDSTTVDGVISTRRGNAGSWTAMIGKTPFGIWELSLPDTAEVRSWFRKGLIEDILFVVTFSARTPPWPGAA